MCQALLGAEFSSRKSIVSVSFMAADNAIKLQYNVKTIMKCMPGMSIIQPHFPHL